MPSRATADTLPSSAASAAPAHGVPREVFEQYIDEALEHLRAAEAALLDLETCPDDTESVNTIFRAFHAIKGASGFLGFDAVHALAHRAENLLEQARSGSIELAHGYADLALESCDALREVLRGLQGGGTPHADSCDTRGPLGRLARPEAPRADDAAEPIPRLPRLGDLLVATGTVRRDAVEEAAGHRGRAPLGQTLVSRGAAPLTDVALALRAQRQIATALASDRGGEGASVRVSAEQLDALAGLVDELVATCDSLADDPRIVHHSAPRLAADVGRASGLVRDVQQRVTALRLVPLRPLFEHMSQLAAGLARRAGKNVRLIHRGDDMQIDRFLADALNEPTVHLLRNAVAHGIESAEERRAAGKAPVGTIRLAAGHEAGGLAIQIADDGRGLDREGIAARGAA
ncbi:Hpt domain-containing protein, partial [bacterium]|nr:Hpt domain-containing protein [bacterium]